MQCAEYYGIYLGEGWENYKAISGLVVVFHELKQGRLGIQSKGE